ncbi:hypothetical protein R1flu_012223 [Riccia fluitans]|uniref:Gag protein n=1 Tax=Riccia fluitans TaxID=41844 RepID=A0ABD1ZA23_9MARC
MVPTLEHIQDCDSPKKAWDALANLFRLGIEARKLQLLQQFNSVKKGSMCINDFVNQIKSLADQLASMKVVVDPIVLIGTILQDLPSEYKQFVTSIAKREPLPTFDQLILMMLGEEVRLQGASSSSQQQEQIYYAGFGGSRGRVVAEQATMLVVNVNPKVVANSNSRCINNLNCNINNLNSNSSRETCDMNAKCMARNPEFINR